MNEQIALSDISFIENGQLDVVQLNALYRLIRWDSHFRWTEAKTTEMLDASRYHIAAYTREGKLVGFARVCGDPYDARVRDVITHPEYRRSGIATNCIHGILAHLRSSRYVTVTLADGSGIEGFYQRFGFQVHNDITLVWKRDA